MQTLIQGAGSIMKTGEIINIAGANDVFVITGQHYQITNEFQGLNFERINHFINSGKFNSEYQVESVSAEFSKKNYYALVAIGGGRVIDLAKAVLYELINSGKPIPFFLAAPTTAGSGSEATQFAVLYKSGKKFSLNNPALLPNAVILDPELTETVSTYQAAVSGMDVLAQSIESFWNLNANDESRQYAKEAIQLWIENFFPAIHEKGNKHREKLLWAAHLAGKAINITRTTGPHAMSYFLTAHYGVPHGQAVVLFLPLFFLYNKPPKQICSLLGTDNPEAAKEQVMQWMKQAGIAVTFGELGIIKKDMIESLLDDVNEERFANNPVPFDRGLLRDLINRHL